METVNGNKNGHKANGLRYRFDEFEIDPANRLLLRDGKTIPLTGKVFDVLLVFAENPGRLLEKDELIEKVWPGDFVEEGNLARNVSTLRKALGDTGSEHKYINTVQGRGYRFVADVISDTAEPEVPIASSAASGRKNVDRRYLWIVPIIVLFVLAIGVWANRDRIFAPQRSEIRSVAVLPFENLSGDPSQEYFADGMTEELISDLSQIKALKVISRTSVMRFKGSRESLPAIAKALGVDAIVEGSVQRSDGRVKVTAQLIHAESDTHIWSRSFERALTDIFKLQNEVAQGIASEIRIQLSPFEQERLASARPVDPKANEEFLLGRYHLQKLNETDLAIAIEHFNEATRIDPTFAAAYAGLSRAWFERGFWGNKKLAEVEIPAREAAKQALALDPDQSLAHTAMGYLNVNFDYDWVGAETHIKRALELDPNSSEANVAYAWFLLSFGRFNEMIEKLTAAEQLDPVSAKIQTDFGRMLYRAQKYDEAEKHLKRSIELDPNSSSAYGRLADVYVEQGRFDEALQMLAKSSGIRNDAVYNLRNAFIYARMGDRQKALEILRHSTSENITDRARLYTALDQFDDAFSVLNAAFDRRPGPSPFLRVEPTLQKLHSDPRWPLLMKRMNLPE